MKLKYDDYYYEICYEKDEDILYSFGEIIEKYNEKYVIIGYDTVKYKDKIDKVFYLCIRYKQLNEELQECIQSKEFEKIEEMHENKRLKNYLTVTLQTDIKSLGTLIIGKTNYLDLLL